MYSTAYALRCLTQPLEQPEPLPLFAKAKRERFAKLGTPKVSITLEVQHEMAQWVAAAQYQDANGFDDSQPAFGGWGFDAPQSPGKPGHMDLAHSRRAMQALAAISVLEQDHDATLPRQQVARRLEQFSARRSETPSGGGASELRRMMARPVPRRRLLSMAGFIFRPSCWTRTRAAFENEPAPHWRSYATATCDGVLALLAAGVPRDDERVTAAAAWLRVHGNLSYPEGVPSDGAEPWAAAIQFYHYAVRAEAYRALDWPGPAPAIGGHRARAATAERQFCQSHQPAHERGRSGALHGAGGGRPDELLRLTAPWSGARVIAVA